jgi:hypothetical protein
MALLSSCSTSTKPKEQMRFTIRGTVSVDGKSSPAIWCTDEFEVKRDTIIITNSDSSQWRIAPPYRIVVRN